MAKSAKPQLGKWTKDEKKGEQDHASRQIQSRPTESRGGSTINDAPHRIKLSKDNEPKGATEKLCEAAAKPPGRRLQARSASKEREDTRIAQLSRDHKPVGPADIDPVAQKNKPVTAKESAGIWKAFDRTGVVDKIDQPRPSQPEATLKNIVEDRETTSKDHTTKDWEGVAEQGQQKLAELHCEHDARTKELEQRIALKDREIQQASALVRNLEEKYKIELLRVEFEREQDKKQTQSLEASICDRLESIQDQIRQACKDFSKLSFDEFDQSLAPAWDQESSDPTCIPNMGKLADALRNNKTMQKTGRASSLLLGCAAIHKVMISVICNPLFALGGEVGLNAAFRHGFGQVLGFAANGDEAAAEALRCQLLRLVDPPKDSNSSTITSMKAIVKESRDTASDQLAQLFLDELSRTYEEEQSARALPVFEKIFREAAELSALLWTRKTRIRHSCPGPRYYSASGDIAAHPFHRAELEDDPRILDGKDIVVLYSPAIWLYGTDDGQNFHQRRLVKKAVAWMG